MEFGNLFEIDGRSYEIRVREDETLKRFNEGSDNPFHSAGTSMSIAIYDRKTGEEIFTSPLTKQEVARVHKMLLGI